MKTMKIKNGDKNKPMFVSSDYVSCLQVRSLRKKLRNRPTSILLAWSAQSTMTSAALTWPSVLTRHCTASLRWWMPSPRLHRGQTPLCIQKVNLSTKLIVCTYVQVENSRKKMDVSSFLCLSVYSGYTDSAYSFFSKSTATRGHLSWKWWADTVGQYSICVCVIRLRDYYICVTYLFSFMCATSSYSA